MEQTVRKDLITYLRSEGRLDERMPDAPDIEEKWLLIAEAYLPHGIREFTGYPTVSLGWMMYTGMAVAALWDKDWERYGQMPDIYQHLRDQRGYDLMDEYILDEVLCLKGQERDKMERLVAECGSRTNSLLHHQHIEPGTKQAFNAYVSCLHQLYLAGAAVWLKQMGYRMEKL